MSVSLKLNGHPLLLLHHHPGFDDFSLVSISKVSKCYWFQNSKSSLINLNRSPRSNSRSCSINGDKINSAYDVSDAPNDEGSKERNESGQGGSLTSNETLRRLKRYGISGILSYGLLNTAYYLTTFLLVWFYVAPAPGRMGYLAAVERFLKVMAMVWAGSQVTKLVRAGGALALAPLVDRGLSWFTVKFKFESQGKAFVAIVGFCFGLAIMLFLVVTLLSA
ncbi:gag-pol polyprotein/retrotransposon [Fagus crenata]